MSTEDLIQVASGLREAKEFDYFPSFLTADPTGLMGLILLPIWYLCISIGHYE